MARPKIAFAFTIEDGRDRGLTSGGWRVWTRHEDTYIVATSLGHVWKTSLHGDSAWRLAVTQEHLATENPVWTERDRAPWKFAPTPFVDGLRLAYVVAACRHALLPRALDLKEVQIRVEDRWDQLTMAKIWMTEPGLTFDAPRLIGGPLPLASGRSVWVSADVEELPGGEPEPIAVSSMIEPLWPEEHGVPAPGLLLKGLHIG